MPEIKDIIPKIDPENVSIYIKAQGLEDVINKKAARLKEIFGEHAIEKTVEGEVLFTALYKAFFEKKKEQISVAFAACRNFLSQGGETLIAEMKEDMETFEKVAQGDLQGEIYKKALGSIWDVRSAFAGGQPDHLEEFKKKGWM